MCIRDRYRALKNIGYYTTTKLFLFSVGRSISRSVHHTFVWMNFVILCSFYRNQGNWFLNWFHKINKRKNFFLTTRTVSFLIFALTFLLYSLYWQSFFIRIYFKTFFNKNIEYRWRHQPYFLTFLWFMKPQAICLQLV